MSDEEKVLFYAIVHGLRSQGWSRIEAEGEALERIVRRRKSASQGPTDNEVARSAKPRRPTPVSIAIQMESE